jgi:enamine deaminase RidA (YjgF/YER057c/UK114 family)
MTPEDKLKSLGLTLPAVPKPSGTYVPFKVDGGTIYLSGQGPRGATGERVAGKVGPEYTIEQAYGHARTIGLQLIATAKVAAQSVGSDLEHVEVLKVLGIINAIPDFTKQPEVINGCSDLFVEILGERGRHARSAVGMASLPGNIPVEIEAIFRIVR